MEAKYNSCGSSGKCRNIFTIMKIKKTNKMKSNICSLLFIIALISSPLFSFGGFMDNLKSKVYTSVSTPGIGRIKTSSHKCKVPSCSEMIDAENETCHSHISFQPCPSKCGEYTYDGIICLKCQQRQSKLRSERELLKIPYEQENDLSKKGMIFSGYFLGMIAPYGLEKDREVSLKGKKFLRIFDKVDLKYNKNHLVEMIFKSIPIYGDIQEFLDSVLMDMKNFYGFELSANTKNRGYIGLKNDCLARLAVLV